jgi:hypothetical protein
LLLGVGLRFGAELVVPPDEPFSLAASEPRS